MAEHTCCILLWQKSYIHMHIWSFQGLLPCPRSHSQLNRRRRMQTRASKRLCFYPRLYLLPYGILASSLWGLLFRFAYCFISSYFWNLFWCFHYYPSLEMSSPKISWPQDSFLLVFFSVIQDFFPYLFDFTYNKFLQQFFNVKFLLSYFGEFITSVLSLYLLNQSTSANAWIYLPS